MDYVHIRLKREAVELQRALKKLGSNNYYNTVVFWHAFRKETVFYISDKFHISYNCRASFIQDQHGRAKQDRINLCH